MFIQTNSIVAVKGDGMETEIIIGNDKYKYDPVKNSISRFNDKYKMWVTVNFSEVSTGATDELIQMLTSEFIKKFQ